MIDKNIEIVFNEQVADSTFLMGLKAPEMVNAASPGQFVMIRVGPVMDPLLRRPFSICGTLNGELILILYKTVGRGTALMSEAKKGDYLTVLGPLGKGFSQPPTEGLSILVAGGIGIAPLFFLAQTLEEKNLIFLTGYRCAAEIVPFNKVGLKAKTGVTATDDGSVGFHGFVTDLLKARWQKDPESPAYIFACGPAAMLKKVADFSLENGIPCQMSLEAYMACGIGACQGCAVKSSHQKELTYYLVCRDGPIFTAPSIDWGAL
jgi:dihydroorotate dehydrogenase electron transfer subunit